MKYKNLIKNRSILLAHDLITYDTMRWKRLKLDKKAKFNLDIYKSKNKYKTNYLTFNQLNFIDSIEITSNIDFKQYKGANYNNAESTKISSKLKLLTTFYLIKQISGQLPCIIKAKKSVSNFNIRAGMEIGVKVSLRKKRLQNFYKNLNLIMLPVKGTRIKKIINNIARGDNINYINHPEFNDNRTDNLTKLNLDESLMRDLINISNLLKLEQEKTGINLEYKTLSERDYILNYFIIPKI